MISGATSTLTPAQVSAYDAQAAANNAAAAQQRQQTAAMAMPKSVASSAPVTGTPQTLVPGTATPAPIAATGATMPTTGLINQAPMTANNVTGAPAA